MPRPDEPCATMDEATRQVARPGNRLLGDPARLRAGSPAPSRRPRRRGHTAAGAGHAPRTSDVRPLCALLLVSRGWCLLRGSPSGNPTSTTDFVSRLTNDRQIAGVAPAAPGVRWRPPTRVQHVDTRSTRGRWAHHRNGRGPPGRGRERDGRPMTTTADPTHTSTGTDVATDGGTTHARLAAWVAEVAALTTPDRISWVTGSEQEWTRLTDELVAAGTFTRLNDDIKPNSFHCASDPSDVARVEDRTFICSVRREGRRSHQQLDGAGRDEGHHARPLPRVHDGPDDVRHPLRHGPPRRRAADVRRRDHRLGVRRGLHARHGPLRHQDPAADRGARRLLRARRCTRSARRSPPASRTSPGRATTPSTSSSSPRSG